MIDKISQRLKVGAAVLLGLLFSQTSFAQTPTNLALGKTVYASSAQPDHPTSASTNGKHWTWWGSTTSGEQTIYIDLESPAILNSVQLQWADRYAIEYFIEGSKDKATWSMLFHDDKGTGGTKDIPVIGTYRYVRMHAISSNSDGYDLCEFQIFGTQQQNPLSVTPTNISFPGDGATPQTVTVKTTSNWYVTASASWCHFSPSSGYGNGSFTVTVDPNPSPTDKRNCTLTVTCPVLVISSPVTVVQDPGTSDFSITPDKWDIVATDNTVKTSTITNGKSCTAGVDYDPPFSGWIHYSITDSEVTLKADQNTSSSIRTCTIWVTSGPNSKPIKITQYANTIPTLVNKALDKDVYDNGCQGYPEFQTEYAVDGYYCQGWQSDPKQKYAQITVNLGESCIIKKINLLWGGQDSPKLEDINIQVSDDNKAFTTVYGTWEPVIDTTTGDTILPGGYIPPCTNRIMSLKFASIGKWVRLNVDQTNHLMGVQLNEFEVWCKP